MCHIIRSCTWGHLAPTSIWRTRIYPKGANDGSIVMAKNPQFHKRTKYVDLHWHWVWELVNNGLINIVDCRNPQQTADIFTKQVPRIKFSWHVNKLGMSLVWGGVLLCEHVMSQVGTELCEYIKDIESLMSMLRPWPLERVSEHKKSNAKANRPATSAVTQKTRWKPLFGTFRAKDTHIEASKFAIAWPVHIETFLQLTCLISLKTVLLQHKD